METSENEVDDGDISRLDTALPGVRPHVLALRQALRNRAAEILARFAVGDLDVELCAIPAQGRLVLTWE
ncbi:hypothetical protein [Niveispirillum sp. KHB5.9]|uniref:hypothetical protein n=1 Tax=Niveispirillum sp. KHB5.9 TaxID=3400269 RepID=UPI003A8C7440